MPSVLSHGAEIYYEIRGQGPAVVFAHGMGGNAISWWQQIPYFAGLGYCVIAFDHRGFGRSTCPVAAFHPDRFPDDVRAILEQEGIERAALVCQSMGGWTGLPTAVQTPERVAALVLCGTPGGIVTEKIVDVGVQLFRRLADGVQSGVAALAPGYGEREPAMAYLYGRIRSFNPGLPPAVLAGFADPSSRVPEEALASYAVPTLLVSGGRDEIFPLDAMRDVAALLPGAKLVSFPDLGHSVYFEDADRFNRVVEDFLAEHRGRFG
jgi:pimeloyl-ACP methyl ester carboxylesterase